MIVEEREYARLLGYPWGSVLEGDVRDRAVEAAEWYKRYGSPRIYCTTVVASVYDRRSFQPPGSKPAVLGRRYNGTVTGITAGREVDGEVELLWNSGRIDEAYFLDRYAAAVVEKMAKDLGPCQSPGTGSLPFEEQWTLFSHLQPLRPEIEMLPSGMLNPKNSLLAYVPFGAEATVNPCTRCQLAGCTFRRKTP